MQPQSPGHHDNRDQDYNECDHGHDQDYDHFDQVSTDQVKDIPPVAKVLSTERSQLENGFEGEKSGENFVSKVEDVLQLSAHPVVLDGQEDGVEDDAEGDDDVEEGVVDDGVEDVLGLEPAGVVEATCSTAGTVAIISSFWKISFLSLASK